MQNENSVAANREVAGHALNGWALLLFNLALVLGGAFLLGFFIYGAARPGGEPHFSRLIAALILEALGILSLIGHFTLQPNEARVLILFGAYQGTVRTSGFHWANPFYARHSKVSLRAHNLGDTAQACFDVVDYEKYVTIQSESAVRHLASSYAYDHGEENEITLRSGGDEVTATLKKELQERLGKAGVFVDEARIMHLAYAPEIAQVMLRRQQAEAVIAARQKIVHGAVSMVEMALRELAEKNVVKLDDERRAAMVSNLLVVLCGEAEVTPVVNTGTLYT